MTDVPSSGGGLQDGADWTESYYPPAELVPAARPAPGPGTLAARAPDVRDRLVAAWLLSKRAANTRDAYRRDVLAFFAWVDEWSGQLGTTDVLALQRYHLDAYREWLTSGEHRTRYHGRRSYSPSTIARKLTAVSSFYGYVTEEAPHLVPSNPMRRVARPEVAVDSSTGALSLDQARQLMDAARESGVMAHALVGLLLTTGVRISEAVKADTGDLGVEEGTRILWVVRKAGRRSKVPVPIGVARVIDRYRRGRRGPLFLGSTGERLKRQQVDRILVRLVKAAGIVDAVGRPLKVTPHWLRRTAATIALDAGRDLVDIQDMLGHRDVKTTRGYIRGRDQLQRSAVHTVAALLGADVDPGEL